jgi:asparagine synthase (glutamine-hydrolysing)
MFAFALWDARERKLWLGRDRLGEKPLYYGWFGSTLLFGSELKALRRHPAWHGTVDRDALSSYLRHLYVPTPRSIYEGVRKLPPATVLEIDASGRERETRYWVLEEIVARGKANPIAGSHEEMVDLFAQQMTEVVREEMVSDVPLGCFLSGGIDSTLVTALMQSVSDQPIRTFTIGFEDAAFNEAEYAKRIAAHLGTSHTEHYVTPEEALSVVPRLPQLYDEPFADSSQIPTFLVAQLARRHVTVALSGDGGDEMLKGYPRYESAPRVWRSLDRIPRSARTGSARVMRSLSPRAWSTVLAPLPSRFGGARVGNRVHTLAHLLASPTPAHAYARTVAPGVNPELVLRGRTNASSHIVPLAAQLADASGEDLYQYIDTLSYLPDDILVKVDRAAMATSLETRVPFLDHRVVEFCWRLPQQAKMRNGQGKRIARDLLSRFVPAAMFERPKMGFSVPLASWLRGPLRDWAGDLLAPTRIQGDGYFLPAPVSALWEEHQRGVDRQEELWPLLMFQAWLDG